MNIPRARIRPTSLVAALAAISLLGGAAAARIGDQVEDAAGSAGLRVARREHDPRDARVHHRHRTHRAGLQRHVQRASEQAVVSDAQPPLAHRNDFRVCRRIVLGDVAVPALSDDLAIGRHQHGADRDFVILFLRAIGKRERVAHPALVVGQFRQSHSIGAGGLPLMS